MLCAPWSLYSQAAVPGAGIPNPFVTDFPPSLDPQVTAAYQQQHQQQATFHQQQAYLQQQQQQQQEHQVIFQTSQTVLPQTQAPTSQQPEVFQFSEVSQQSSEVSQPQTYQEKKVSPLSQVPQVSHELVQMNDSEQTNQRSSESSKSIDVNGFSQLSAKENSLNANSQLLMEDLFGVSSPVFSDTPNVAQSNKIPAAPPPRPPPPDITPHPTSPALSVSSTKSAFDDLNDSIRMALGGPTQQPVSMAQQQQLTQLQQMQQQQQQQQNFAMFEATEQIPQQQPMMSLGYGIAPSQAQLPVGYGSPAIKQPMPGDGTIPALNNQKSQRQAF